MKSIGRDGTMGTFLVFVLISGIYGFQASTASCDVDVSKRQDFATADTAFGTNEDIYIRIPHGETAKLKEGKKTKLQVQVTQQGKKKIKEGAKLTIEGDKTEVSYRDDVQPLFTKGRAWFDKPDVFAALACGACHYCNEEPPCYHAMNLTTRAGMLAGADAGGGCGEPILGQSECGDTGYHWDDRSVLMKRLRNNRMPPGMPFVLDESNRDGADISITDDGNDLKLECPDCACASTDCTGTSSAWYVKLDEAGNIQYGGKSGSEFNAVGLIAAWVNTAAGGGTASYGPDTDVTWCDIAPFFCQPNVWYNGALACTYCHHCNDEPPCFHAMNLCNEAGIKAGPDVDPDTGCGEPILGQSECGKTDYHWEGSTLQWRLRNNRMPPNSPLVLDESNRNGRYVMHPVTGADTNAVDLIGEWVDAGAKDN